MMDCDVQILPGDWQQGGRAGRAGTTPCSGGQLLRNHQGNFAFMHIFLVDLPYVSVSLIFLNIFFIGPESDHWLCLSVTD